MATYKNYNYIINYQISIYDIINNNQIIIANSLANDNPPYLLQTFKLINNLFLPNANSLIISLVCTSKTAIYNSSIAEGSIVKLVENKDNISYILITNDFTIGIVV